VGAGSDNEASVSVGSVGSVVSTGASLVSSGGVVDSGSVVSVGVAASEVVGSVGAGVDRAGAWVVASLERLVTVELVPGSAASEGSGGLTKR
jgi:hypothetical protein